MSTTFLLWYRWSSKFENTTGTSVSLAGREWMAIMKMKTTIFKQNSTSPLLSVIHEPMKVVFLRGGQSVFRVFRYEIVFS